MNDEIKEILDNIKRQNEWEGIEYFKTPLSTKQATLLLDYITNLQQENEKLQTNVNDCKQKLDHSNSKIEEALKMLEHIGLVIGRPLTINEMSKLYSILQGDDKSE